MVNTIRRSALSLLAIINDILDVSKIEAKHLELENLPTSIQYELEGVGATLGPDAANKSLDFLLYIDPDIPDWVQTDPMRLRQILLNLAGNAIKFTNTDDHRIGRVVIRVDLEKPIANDMAIIQFRVTDNGIGLSEDGIGKIFQPFTQAETSTTRKFGGTGLGMTITRHILDKMSAAIDIDSELGLGTSFLVRLPLEIAEDQAASLQEFRDFEGLHVLIASTDEEHGGFLSDYLEKCKATVVRSSNLSSVSFLLAAEREKEQPIDVVVLDDNWFDTDQIELCNAIIELERASGVRFVVTRWPGTNLFGKKIDSATYIDNFPLGRREFLQGVALATERLSREVIEHALLDRLLLENLPVPSFEEAEAVGELVLVAEDIQVNREVIRRQLNKLGWKSVV